jgi:hypothetical protein
MFTYIKVKKVKFALEEAVKAQSREYGSNLSLTSALGGGGWW